MNIRVTARHFDMEPDLKAYVEDKVSRLARYFDRVEEAHVVLDAEGHRKIADVTVHASRVTVSSEQAAGDLRSAFDRAVDKVERQIRRHKERVRNHKGKDSTAVAAKLVGGTVPEELGIMPEALAGAPGLHFISPACTQHRSGATPGRRATMKGYGRRTTRPQKLGRAERVGQPGQTP